MSALSGAFNTSDPDPRAQRIQVAAEQRRLDAAAQLEVERGRLALDRQRQIARDNARRERQHTRRQNRTALAQRINTATPAIGRKVLIGGPILAPMTVAWIGQIQFAQGTLSWPLYAAVVFAASWELTTAFSGWMYHQARQDGDRGSLFRAATWLFAASAGGMNYWHALGGSPITHPTPKAVSYGAMSLVGIALWELYASLIHRKQLRDRGALPPARPRFGVARWVRYPRLTFTAWSLSIRDGLATTEAAWTAALAKPYKIEPNAVPVDLPVVEAGPMVGLQTGPAAPPIGSETQRVDRSGGGSETQVPIRSETGSTDRSGDQVPDLPANQVPDRSATEVSDPGPQKSQTGPKKQTRTRRKAATAKPLDRLDEARAADASYLAEHGRHIPAEKLASALRIGKPAALELVKQVRGAQMDIAK